jgi:uncharacterized membrane protein YraQ (UPF0718 family)
MFMDATASPLDHEAAIPSGVPPRARLEVVVALLVAIAIAGVFWSTQRYPSLLKKLHSGQHLHVAGAISFDALLKVTPGMPLAERVGRTAVNWLWTNRFGMYFALPFGAAAMTGLGLQRQAKRKGFQSAAANIACGALMGAPAGVCTNCATPIAQSLLVSGVSTRMTLAAMISSPSFNPVVIAMAIALLPWRIAAARILAPAVLLLLLPLLVKEREIKIKTLSLDEAPKPLMQRFRELAINYVRNLLRLTLLTLPWMLLAAVIGAVTVEMFPSYATAIPVSAWGVVVVAILGTLLPVPMAFDVALAWVLYRAGVPQAYVAALVCTLGVVSAYSLFAVGQQLGRRVPLRLASATAALGCIAGFAVLST